MASRAEAPAAVTGGAPPGGVGGLNVFESEGDAVGSGVYGRAVARATIDARLLPQHDPDELLGKFEQKAREWVQGLGAGELSLSIWTWPHWSAPPVLRSKM